MFHDFIGAKVDKKSERQTRIEIEQIKSDLVTIENSKKILNPTTDRDQIVRLDKRALTFTKRLTDLWEEEEAMDEKSKKELKKREKPLRENKTNDPVIKIPSVTTIPTYNNPKEIRSELYTSGVLSKMTLVEKEKLVQDIDSITSMTNGQNDLRKKLKTQISRMKATPSSSPKDEVEPLKFKVSDVPTHYLQGIQHGASIVLAQIFNDKLELNRKFLLQLLRYPKCIAQNSDWDVLEKHYAKDREVMATFAARTPEIFDGDFRDLGSDKEFVKMVLSVPGSGMAIQYVDSEFWDDVEMLNLAIENGDVGDDSVAILHEIREKSRYYLRTEEGPWTSVDQLDTAVVAFPDEIVLKAIKKNEYNIFGASPRQTHDAEFLKKAIAVNRNVALLIEQAQEPGSDIDLEDGEGDE